MGFLKRFHFAFAGGMSLGLEKQCETYLAKVPVACRDKVLDDDHGGLDTHLVQLAQRLSNWESILAVELGLTNTEISDIQTVCFREPGQAR